MAQSCNYTVATRHVRTTKVPFFPTRLCVSCIVFLSLGLSPPPPSPTSHRPPRQPHLSFDLTMRSGEDVTDSTDWLPTPLAALAPLESSLRCQVCKDFYRTPMMTSCSHTFCSICIRRYLSQEGRCPTCREADQEIRLRRNWVVEELVGHFENGRKGMMDFATKVMVVAQQDSRDVDSGRPAKRRKVAVDSTTSQSAGRRSTRSQSRRMASQNGYASSQQSQEMHDDQNNDIELRSVTDSGSVYEDEAAATVTTISGQKQVDDGLVACPCCGKRMKEAVINSHLDSCINGGTPPTTITTLTSSPSRRSNTPQQITTTAPSYPQTKPPTQKERERLPTLNYSMLNPTQMAKKLRDLGIPSHGGKELMRRRHTEWVNLWNANCDSRHPVSKQKLLQELSVWERTLGKQIVAAGSGSGSSTGVMVKDFDREDYQKSNKSEFDDLIRKAREKRAAAAAAAAAATAATTTKVAQTSASQDESEGGDGVSNKGANVVNGNRIDNVAAMEDQLTSGHNIDTTVEPRVGESTSHHFNDLQMRTTTPTPTPTSTPAMPGSSASDHPPPPATRPPAESFFPRPDISPTINSDSKPV